MNNSWVIHGSWHQSWSLCWYFFYLYQRKECFVFRVSSTTFSTSTFVSTPNRNPLFFSGTQHCLYFFPSPPVRTVIQTFNPIPFKNRLPFYQTTTHTHSTTPSSSSLSHLIRDYFYSDDRPLLSRRKTHRDFRVNSNPWNNYHCGQNTKNLKKMGELCQLGICCVQMKIRPNITCPDENTSRKKCWFVSTLYVRNVLHFECTCLWLKSVSLQDVPTDTQNSHTRTTIYGLRMLIKG